MIRHAAEIYRSRHLLTAEGLGAEEIVSIFKIAEYFVEQGINGRKRHDILRGMTVISAFFETSTRTKISFDLAARRLGADVTAFQATASSLAKGESLLDTLATINAMGADMWVVRHSQSGAVELMSRNSDCIFLNAGDGRHQHPTQGLLDCFTLWRRWKGEMSGKRVCIIGDIEHSRVARSNFLLLQTLGCETGMAAPGTLIPHSWPILGARRFLSSKEACEWADAAIFLRLQKERMEGGLLPANDGFAKRYGMTCSLLQKLPHLTILHPGPVNYGVEIDAESAADKRSVIREQVTNGVAVRMAVMSVLAQKQRH
ncbi:MAG: aspartate carbamoyltransferase catalytic subunit [Bacteroidetes bacterium]|nr:aspartate carbamoyltransferase catalytic subunit [Bacteroidota bacterium]